MLLLAEPITHRGPPSSREGETTCGGGGAGAGLGARRPLFDQLGRLAEQLGDEVLDRDLPGERPAGEVLASLVLEQLQDGVGVELLTAASREPAWEGKVYTSLLWKGGTPHEELLDQDRHADR